MTQLVGLCIAQGRDGGHSNVIGQVSYRRLGISMSQGCDISIIVLPPVLLKLPFRLFLALLLARHFNNIF